MELFESDAMQHDEGAKLRRLLALGSLLQVYRSAKRWSVEQAALHAGIGHMTWRRAEQGVRSRNRTYAQMDGLFGLPLGSVARATNDDELLADLARHLGVEVVGDPAEWVQAFARGASTANRLTDPNERVIRVKVGPGGRPTEWIEEATGQRGSYHRQEKADPDIAAVVGAIERIRAWPPAATNTEAIRSLLAALENHLIDPTTHKVTTHTAPDGSFAVHVEPRTDSS